MLMAAPSSLLFTSALRSKISTLETLGVYFLRARKVP